MASVFVLGCAGIACSGGAAVNNSDDAGLVSVDATTAADATAKINPDLAGASAAMNGCGENDYADLTLGTDSDRMIMLTGGGVFDYPCMTIKTGQSIEFMWKFSTYPLAPGLAPSHATDPAGTTPSPIQMHNTGSLYVVKFTAPGLYPFHVPMHDADMLGVIQVQ